MRRGRDSLSWRTGLAVGFAIAPAFAWASRLRNARALHPRGVTYAARVSAEAASPYPALAGRLAGPALLRFSGALWMRLERLDVLGCAVRFCRDTASSGGDADVQDLLFATIRRPWTMPIAPLLTNPRDYLDNLYFAVSPFVVDAVGHLYFRLRPERVEGEMGRRAKRLADAVEGGKAWLRLEAAPGPWGAWQPVALIEVCERAERDDDSLRFDPFANARGIRPVGFVHALRRGVYLSSQKAGPGGTPRA